MHQYECRPTKVVDVGINVLIPVVIITKIEYFVQTLVKNRIQITIKMNCLIYRVHLTIILVEYIQYV